MCTFLFSIPWPKKQRSKDWWNRRSYVSEKLIKERMASMINNNCIQNESIQIGCIVEKHYNTEALLIWKWNILRLLAATMTMWTRARNILKQQHRNISNSGLAFFTTNSSSLRLASPSCFYLRYSVSVVEACKSVALGEYKTKTETKQATTLLHYKT